MTPLANATGTALANATDLSVLSGEPWMEVRHPFPHFVAQDVFERTFYERLESAFSAVLARGLQEAGARGQFSRAYRGYDAYGATLPDDPENPLSIFLSRPWHDMLADLLRVRATGDVDAALHHHRIGSGNGEVHNDYNPGYFTGAATPDKVNSTNNSRCTYKTGDCPIPGEMIRRTVRAVAVLFYLNNPDWRPGDGGETGLYGSESDSVVCPARTVAPCNNSMLVFRCNPFSYHAFLSNKRKPRNSVIMWLHESMEDACGRWTESAIVNW